MLFASTNVSEVLLILVHVCVTFETLLLHLRIVASLRISHTVSIAWTDRHMIHIANYKE